ncbi:hypothetical protein PLESTF_000221900 [Pleodorina starrii]|nr:hypothetical protein PLESTF_000221900 [Pleodorina starrii]
MFQSTQPDASACCRSCLANTACAHWDWDRSTRVCRLLKDWRYDVVLDIAYIRLDERKVLGTRNVVSTYLRNPNYKFPLGFNTTDTLVRWISTVPTSFVPIANGVFASPAGTTVNFYTTVIAPPAPDDQPSSSIPVNVRFMAEEIVTLRINAGQTVYISGAVFERGGAPVFSRMTLVAGQLNVVAMQCRSWKGYPVAVLTMTLMDGTVVVRSDHNWLWL